MMKEKEMFGPLEKEISLGNWLLDFFHSGLLLTGLFVFVELRFPCFRRLHFNCIQFEGL